MTRTRLLIIHPNPSALAMLVSMLQALGHDLLEAADDRIALRMLQSQPGLVLIGVDPAEPDALELLSYVRRKYSTIPSLLLFTAPHPEQTNQALRMGAVAVLRFPLPAVELRAAVVQALSTNIDPPPTEEEAEAPPVVEPPDPPEPRLEGMQVATPCPCTCHVQTVGEASTEPQRVGDAMQIRPLKQALEDPEREIILQALRAYGGNRNETAMALDINRTTLYKKMKRYGLLDKLSD